MLGSQICQRRLQCAEGKVRIVLGHNQRIGAKAVRSRVMPRNYAGNVGPRDRRKHRVVVVASDSFCREPSEIGGQFWRYLCRLQPIESNDDNRGVLRHLAAIMAAWHTAAP